MVHICHDKGLCSFNLSFSPLFQVPICHTCKEKAEAHENHDTLALQRAAANVRVDLQKQSDEAKQYTTDMEVLMRHIKEALLQVDSNAQTANRQIRTECEQAMAALQNHMSLLLHDVKAARQVCFLLSLPSSVLCLPLCACVFCE
jgi:hypothetical protein